MRLGYWLPFVLVAVVLAGCGWSSGRHSATYSALIRYTHQHQLKRVVLRPMSQEIDATLKDGTTVVVNYPTDQAATKYQDLLFATHQGAIFSSEGGR